MCVPTPETHSGEAGTGAEATGVPLCEEVYSVKEPAPGMCTWSSLISNSRSLPFYSLSLFVSVIAVKVCGTRYQGSQHTDQQ